MASILELIGKAVDLSLKKEELYFKVGTASEIDLSDFTFTFTPNDETAPVEKTLLKAIATASGGSFVIIPDEGSFVVVGFTSSVTAVCVHVEVSSSILMVASEVKIDADLTVFNGGAFEGLVKIVELTAKLNELRTNLNNFYAQFRTHVHGGVTTGAGVSGTTPTSPTDATAFDKDDYEDTNVTH